MADTRRTLAALQALLADNTAGDISAQDVRDFLISAYNPQLAAGGRLTLESGVPVSTTDQTAKTTLYYTPCVHDQIGLYDGTSWKLHAFTEISLALGTLTSGMNYDVFLYDNSGTLTLELTAWTDDTTRATALATTDGVYLKTGALTRRYVGTIRTTATTTTEDSEAKRFVWNAHNRAPRKLKRRETAASWTYSTTAWRQANANAANQVAFVRGIDADAVSLALVAWVAGGSGSNALVGIGMDSVTAVAADCVYGANNANTQPMSLAAAYAGLPGLGYHYLAWIENRIAGSATITVYGTGSSGETQGGLVGVLFA